MRHSLLALLPWTVTAWGWAQERPATVRYTHLGTFEKEAVRFGDECFVPVTLVSQWGWRVQISEGMADVQAEGRLVKVVARPYGGKTMIPLIQSLQQLGAKFDWTDDSTLSVRGIIRNLDIQKGGLRIDSTLAFLPRLVRPESGKIAIDLEGAWIDPKSKFDLPKGVTLKQIQPDLAQLTIEKTGVDGAIVPTMAAGRTLDLQFDGVVLRDPDPAALKPKTNEKVDPASFAPRRNPDLDPPPSEAEGATQVQPAPTPPPTPVATLGETQFANETEGGTVLVMPITGTPPTRPTATYFDPTTIVIELAGTTYAGTQGPRSAFVNGVEISGDDKGAVHLTLSLKRPMAFELGVEGGAVKLRLTKPKATGKLNGKVIVVDAGHGGHDSGARGGDAIEKDLTLSIARLLAKELIAQGASVIMTRSDDTFIPLKERPAIANRARADFFIAVHINSNTVANRTSGQISFYHMQDSMGILLAECIQTEMAKVSGLPSLGIWSDSRIYKNGGFAVLKYATMPAVLLELGFINHDVDRATMKTAKFQQDIARAIVRGVKTYLGGNGGQ